MSAKREDVEAALLRPLTQRERGFVDTLLARALRIIEAELGPVAKVDESVQQVVADVQAEMVARRLRNPEGKASESDGEYSYSLSNTVASGVLELTDRDRALLGLSSGGLFVINPSFGGGRA